MKHEATYTSKATHHIDIVRDALYKTKGCDEILFQLIDDDNTKMHEVSLESRECNQSQVTD